tara:strand:+ start:2287 stop:2820 length:534 start_codon:yes stop_codon:yes gene_type:complete
MNYNGYYLQHIVDNDQTNQKLLTNQEHLCYICSQTFILNDLNHDQLIIKTSCNHFFHYNCLKMAILNIKSYQNKRECPYCRNNTGWLPLTIGKPIRHIHKEYNQSGLPKKLICKAILKSGKKKGQICGCKGNVNYENKCCGRHKNYVLPITNEIIEEKDKEFIKQNWFRGQIIKCYL